MAENADTPYVVRLAVPVWDVFYLKEAKNEIKPTKKDVGMVWRKRGNRLFIAIVSIGLACRSVAASFDCLIEPTQIVELASPVTGLLERVTVKRGDRIGKNQMLAMIESRAEQAAVDLADFKSKQVGPTRLAENKIEFAKRKFARRQTMANERLMSAQDSDDAESEYRLAEAELQVAQENRQLAKLEYQQQISLLNLRSIRSPVDGVVVEQAAYQGEVVEPGGNKKVILKVAQLDPLRVHVILPKELFGKLNPGMAVAVIPEIPAQGRYTAKIKTLDRLVDAASGTFVAFLEMPNPKLEIPAGVKCKATFADIEAAPRAAAKPK